MLGVTVGTRLERACATCAPHVSIVLASALSVLIARFICTHQAAAGIVPPKPKAAAAAADAEDLDPSAYRENRITTMAALERDGKSPYPHKFHCTTSIPEFVEKFSGLEDGSHVSDVRVAVAGRLHFARSGMVWCVVCVHLCVCCQS